MVLELQDKPNIRDLTLDKPEAVPGFYFDPSREISADDFRHMRSGYSFSVPTDFEHGLSQHKMLKVLCPDKFAQVKMGDTQWNWLLHIIENTNSQFDRRYYKEYLIGYYADAKVLFPDRFKEINPDNSMWEVFKSELADNRRGDRWWVFHKHLLYLSIIDPEKAKEIPLDNFSLRGIEEEYQKSLKAIPQFPDNWQQVAEPLAYIKLFYPEEFTQMNIDPAMFSQMRNQLDKYRRDNKWGYFDFTGMAFQMAVLGAKEIHFTDKGMELVPADPPFTGEKSAAFPEVRNF